MPRRPRQEGVRLSKFKYSRRPENRVRRGERRVLFTLTRLAGHHGKHYSFPSQAKILALLQRWFRVEMSRRTLNRHLLALQLDLYLSRTRRIEYRKNKGMMFRSTLYKVGARHMGELYRHLIDLRKMLASAAASSRVPFGAQYEERIYRLLISGGGYPQAAGPPRAIETPAQGAGVGNGPRKAPSRRS